MRAITGLLAALLICLFTRPARGEVVRFPGDDSRWDFVVAVLELALARSAAPGEQDRVVRLPSQMQQRRISELERGGADVAGVFASRELLSGPLPVVPLPLTRGLLGWRLLMVRSEDVAAMSRVQTLAELRAFRLGHPMAFADYALMRDAGFTITSASRYDGLFRMLEFGRLDWLSRSVIEIQDELQDLRAHGVSSLVELPGLGLHYRADWLFAVSPRRAALRERLARGLARAIQDGSYARLFDAHFGVRLRQIDTEPRRWLTVPNPAFPAIFPNLPADWFWTPKADAKPR